MHFNYAFGFLVVAVAAVAALVAADVVVVVVISTAVFAGKSCQRTLKSCRCRAKFKSILFFWDNPGTPFIFNARLSKNCSGQRFFQVKVAFLFSMDTQRYFFHYLFPNSALITASDGAAMTFSYLLMSRHER